MPCHIPIPRLDGLSHTLGDFLRLTELLQHGDLVLEALTLRLFTGEDLPRHFAPRFSLPIGPVETLVTHCPNITIAGRVVAATPECRDLITRLKCRWQRSNAAGAPVLRTRSAAATRSQKSFGPRTSIPSNSDECCNNDRSKKPAPEARARSPRSALRGRIPFVR